jgi:FAD synthase
LYNQNITIIFRFRLRDEMKFEDVKLLTMQMELDKQTAMSLLS